MPDRARILSAAVLGLAGGMRTFVPPAALSLRGRLVAPPLALIVAGTAAGEMAADKHPAMPSRLGAQGIVARLAASGGAGAVLGGPAGAVAAAVAAMASAQACSRARVAIRRRTGHDMPAALVEDVLSASLAALATR
ncbi:MAG: hypothetical protein ACXVFN_07720 [Solirubrobacteraceae bacterium]